MTIKIGAILSAHPYISSKPLMSLDVQESSNITSVSGRIYIWRERRTHHYLSSIFWKDFWEFFGRHGNFLEDRYVNNVSALAIDSTAGMDGNSSVARWQSHTQNEQTMKTVTLSGLVTSPSVTWTFTYPVQLWFELNFQVISYRLHSFLKNNYSQFSYLPWETYSMICVNLEQCYTPLH